MPNTLPLAGYKASKLLLRGRLTVLPAPSVRCSCGGRYAWLLLSGGCTACTQCTHWADAVADLLCIVLLNQRITVGDSSTCREPADSHEAAGPRCFEQDLQYWSGLCCDSTLTSASALVSADALLKLTCMHVLEPADALLMQIGQESCMKH